MTREEIKNKVAAIVADKTGFPSSEIKDNTSFKYNLGTDSLDEVEIVMEFEREFGITIKDEELMGVVTVGDAIDVICKKFDVPICKQQDADLYKLVAEEFASRGRTTEYGLVVTYNRDDFYRFIKRMALVFNARKEK